MAWDHRAGFELCRMVATKGTINNIMSNKKITKCVKSIVLTKHRKKWRKTPVTVIANLLSIELRFKSSLTPGSYIHMTMQFPGQSLQNVLEF